MVFFCSLQPSEAEEGLRTPWELGTTGVQYHMYIHVEYMPGVVSRHAFCPKNLKRDSSPAYNFEYFGPSRMGSV